jgi:diguanylate cyclase (GGDEF)-like protein
MADGGTMQDGKFSRRKLDPKGGSWPALCLVVVGVVALASLARFLSEQAAGATARWAWFVALVTVFMFGLVAVPLRLLLVRQQRGLVHATKVARQQAVTDPLTGLLNRRSLDDIVRSLLEEGVQFSVSICDLDMFKQLNDSYGHDVGDRALRLFATTLRSVVRNGDFVARMGGEEFVLILPDSSKRVGLDVLQRARVHLSAELSADPMPSFTFSGGVADTTEAVEWGQLLRLADQRLLAAKRSGRDRVLASLA